MNTQTHRTCIRMSQEEYDLLKEKSRAAGLSANAWLMSWSETAPCATGRSRRERPSPLRMRLAGTSTPWPGHSTVAAAPPSIWTWPSTAWSRWWNGSGKCESWGTPMRHKRRPRPPMRDNSCSLSVRMTEEQYQRLFRYLAITRLPVTTYFRKLIKEATIHARMPRQKIAPHPAVNHIYSNIRQIARCPRARELPPEQIAQLEFLADKLCEECFLLSTQQ